MKLVTIPFRLLLPVFLVVILSAYLPLRAQTPTAGDCLGATPVCQDVYYEPQIFSGPGAYNNEIPKCAPSFCTTCCPGNCLDGEWNSAWYIFTVQEGGLLRFTIQPDVTSDDYDWAVYNLSEKRCEDIYSNISSMQKSCNAAGITNTTGMNSNNGGNAHCNVCGTAGTNKWNADLMVLAGQTYVLYVSNWGSGAQGGFTLDFSASTAVIYDDVPPAIASVDADEVSGCSETEITIHFTENVTCAGMSPFLFTIEGPGGPYQVTEVFGPACDVGGEWEKEFILTVDHPFSSNGEYTLYMSTGFPGIQDACNNIAPADTISFTLDLGAPEVDDSGLTITESTCGMDNGAITGIEVSGQGLLNYIWKNQQGAVVGNTLDLLNIPGGTYTLEVHDLNDCVAYAGPYDVPETGVPEIDDTDIVITSSNYGSSTGSITGIVVVSSYTITDYIWNDEDGNQVGSELDLTGVSSGYYDLTVVDENTCEAYAGPYFVGEIGGPLTSNPSANPSVICRGESSTLSPGAGGGIGNYTFQWSSNPAGFSSTLEHPVVMPEVTTRYYVLIEDNGLQVTDSVDVTVNQLPVPFAGDDQDIPHGTYTFLEGSASVGSGQYNYFWTPVDKLEDATVQDPQTKKLYETTPFHLEVEDAVTGCYCAAPDEVVVNIAGGILSTNPTSFPDSVFCIGETFWLRANAGGGSGDYSYTWTSEPPMGLPSGESFSLTLFDPGTYYFYVKVNDGYNDVFGYVKVVVDPAPVIDLGAPVQYCCVMETITLDAGNPGASYLWTNGDTSRIITMGTTGLGYEVQTIGVSVLNAEGCQADTSITVIFDYDHCPGIGENGKNPDVRIYPNPATGKVVLEVHDVAGKVGVRVTNALGVEQYQAEYQAGDDRKLVREIDLSSLAKGLYFVRINANNLIMTTEVILH